VFVEVCALGFRLLFSNTRAKAKNCPVCPEGGDEKDKNKITIPSVRMCAWIKGGRQLLQLLFFEWAKKEKEKKVGTTTNQSTNTPQNPSGSGWLWLHFSCGFFIIFISFYFLFYFKFRFWERSSLLMWKY
jgi:hypothetical protein